MTKTIITKRGASIAYIHARDKNGKHVADVNIYSEIKKLVRNECDIIISFSTGGKPNLSNEERIQSAFADPEMCSLNMGTLVRPGWKVNNVFLNPPELLEEWAFILKQRGIKAELEVYNHSMFVDVESVIQKGLIEKPYFINLVLGMKRQGTLSTTSKVLLSMIDFLPQDCVFNITVVGKMQLPLTTLGLLLGGNLCVGLEDNVYYSKGVLGTNEQLVERSTRIIREVGFEVATPKEARQILGLPAIN